MHYLQYCMVEILQSQSMGGGFKPYYKWITFNIKNVEELEAIKWE